MELLKSIKNSSFIIKRFLDDVLKASKRNLSQSDVYRMLSGAEMDCSPSLDRLLSKLKHDIFCSYRGIEKINSCLYAYTMKCIFTRYYELDDHLLCESMVIRMRKLKMIINKSISRIFGVISPLK